MGWIRTGPSLFRHRIIDSHLFFSSLYFPLGFLREGLIPSSQFLFYLYLYLFILLVPTTVRAQAQIGPPDIPSLTAAAHMDPIRALVQGKLGFSFRARIRATMDRTFFQTLWCCTEGQFLYSVKEWFINYRHYSRTNQPNVNAFYILFICFTNSRAPPYEVVIKELTRGELPRVLCAKSVAIMHALRFDFLPCS